MKKKILISIVILIGIIALFTILVFFYINRVEKITEHTGKFFDTSSKQLGSCVIEAKWRKLDTEPKYKTIYYNPDQSLIGSCEGNSFGSKIGPESIPTICEPLTLQVGCDQTIYPTETYPFCSQAKYECHIEITEDLSLEVNKEVNTVTFNLGEEFILHKDEIAQLKDNDVFLNIEDFYYNPCPEGTQCIWSGLSVTLRLNDHGSIYYSGHDIPEHYPKIFDSNYQVALKDSDYKIFAKFIVNKKPSK